MEKKNETSLLAQSVKRNIRFWGGQAENIFMIFMVAVVFYGLVMGSTSNIEDHSTFDDLLKSVELYAMIFSGIAPFVVFTLYAVPKMSMIISFGARRSETFFGLQFMLWLLIFQMFGAVCICDLFLKNSTGLIKLYSVVLLLCIAAGQLAGCIALKFGNKGVVISVILMVVGFVITGLLLVVSEIFGLQGGNRINDMILFGTVVGIIFYVIGAFLWKKLLSSYEVKM